MRSAWTYQGCRLWRFFVTPRITVPLPRRAISAQQSYCPERGVPKWSKDHRGENRTEHLRGGYLAEVGGSLQFIHGSHSKPTSSSWATERRRKLPLWFPASGRSGPAAANSASGGLFVSLESGSRQSYQEARKARRRRSALAPVVPTRQPSALGQRPLDLSEPLLSPIPPCTFSPDGDCQQPCQASQDAGSNRTPAARTTLLIRKPGTDSWENARSRSVSHAAMPPRPKSKAISRLEEDKGR